MLGGGMDLETDLGIDSIKKVEIFAAVRERAEGMPATDSPQMARLFQLRTLDEVVRWAGSPGDAALTAPTALSGNVEREGGEEIVTAVMRRLQVRLLAAP